MMAKKYLSQGPVYFSYLIVILFECGLCDFKHSADGFVYTDKKYGMEKIGIEIRVVVVKGNN